MATQRRKSTKRPRVRPSSKITKYKEYKGISEVLLDESKERAALIMLGMLRLSGVASPALTPKRRKT